MATEKANAINPLELHVDAILENSNYLTSAMVVKLQALLPEKQSAEKKRSLKGQLERMFRLLDKLDAISTSSENISEMKQVISSAKELYTLVAKYEQTISSEEKLLALEATIVDVLSDESDELKARFLANWKKKITDLEKSKT